MRRRPWLLSPFLAVALVALAAAPSDDEALARNRQRLALWRGDLEHHARLLRDLEAFFALPLARQAQIRDLDTRLNSLDETHRTRLWAVLERYGQWLDRLPEEMRRQVLDAPDSQTRLELIRGLREKEWIDRLPKSDRDQLARMSETARRKRVTELRHQERRRKNGERFVPAEWKKARLSALPREVQEFVRSHLMPVLPQSERTALQAAEGKWPTYPRKIIELSDHYLLLRPFPRVPMSYSGLPNDLKKRILAPPKDKKILASLRRAEGWPGFALALSKACKTLKLKPPPLGACRPEDYPAAARTFIDKELTAALSKVEREALKHDMGRWPEYPSRLMSLSRRHGLLIPGVSLPGPPELWEAAQDAW